MGDLLKQTYFGNTLQEYMVAVGILVITALIIQIIRRVILHKLKKIVEESRRANVEFVVKSLNRFLIPALYLGVLYFALNFLSFGAKPDKIIGIVYVVIVTWYTIRFIISLLGYFLSKYFEKLRGEEDSKKLKPLISFINFIVWLVGLLFLLDNFGFKISAIVAGLGITGIAVALAAQALLGDLFSYFVIFFDRPFEIGDFVNFEGNAGVIEKIGIKTTRIRSLSGEQLIVSNSKLTNTLVHNFKRMERRRVLFQLGVTYQTKSKQLKKIPSLVREIIERNEFTQFDRGHFQGYGDFSLNFEFVYFILSPDYITYMDTQEKINLEIFEEFEKLGIEFAYPTQTLFVNKANQNKSSIGINK